MKADKLVIKEKKLECTQMCICGHFPNLCSDWFRVDHTFKCTSMQTALLPSWLLLL